MEVACNIFVPSYEWVIVCCNVVCLLVENFDEYFGFKPIFILCGILLLRMGMYEVIWNLYLWGKGIHHGQHGCYYIQSNWFLFKTCMMSFMVYHNVEFQYGKRHEEQDGNSFLGRMHTHYGSYWFSVILEHGVLAIREECHWKGAA